MPLARVLSTLSARWLYLAGALVIGALLGGALYLEYYQHQEPCPLCMVQRLAFICMLVFFVLGALHNPGRLGTRIYSGFIIFFALFGIAVAGRHIWIQHLPADEIPSCGPGLDYMLAHFPMSHVLQDLLHGSGECAVKGWSFIGLNLPEWSLVFYILLGGLAVYTFLRVRRT